MNQGAKSPLRTPRRFPPARVLRGGGLHRAAEESPIKNIWLLSFRVAESNCYVLRDRLGELEDRFFATVFLGSGLLFLAAAEPL
jgi:hypothetical protein